MSRSKKNPEEGRKSSKREQLENMLGLPYDRIIAEKLPKNISRQDACRLLSQLTEGKIKFGPSSVWNWVKDEQENGRLVGFDFSGKRSNSINSAKKRVIHKRRQDKPKPSPLQETKNELSTETLPIDNFKEIKEVEEIEEIKEIEEIEEVVYESSMIEFVARCKCDSCKAEFEKEIECSDLSILGLRAIRCPECESWGSCILHFQHNEIDARKVIEDKDGHQHEIFVDEDLHPIDNPFAKEVTHTTN